MLVVITVFSFITGASCFISYDLSPAVTKTSSLSSKCISQEHLYIYIYITSIISFCAWILFFTFISHYPDARVLCSEDVVLGIS